MELKKLYTEDITSLTAFGESRIGGRAENQDSYGWSNTPFGYVVAVCDGMGGGPGGKTASSIAVKEIIDSICEAAKDEKINNIIIKAIRKANMAIIEAGNEDKKLKGMGSTATVLVVNEKSAVVAHVGDSRAYQLRDGKKIFRTFDHSMVFEMVKQGVITEEQARLSSQSNVITRALGIQPDLEVEVHEVPYEKGDRFVLCTDGIHGAIKEKDLVKMLSNKKRNAGAAIDDIVTLVDNTGRSNGGGHDNMTLAMVEMNINSKLKAKMTKTGKKILLALVACLAISIAVNVLQVKCGHYGEVKQLNDSIESVNGKNKALNDSITKLNNTILEQESQLKVIKNIVNKNQ